VATRLETIHDKINGNQMRVEPKMENLEKMEPNPGETEAVLEQQRFLMKGQQFRTRTCI
jgi:hypothetical protein